MAFIPEKHFVHASKSYIGTEDVARYFGVSTRTIFRWIENEQFPFYVLGKRNLFRIAECRIWWERNKLKTGPQRGKKESPSKGKVL